MMWIVRILSPWLVSGAVLGVTMWLVMFVSPWLLLPGFIAAAFAAVALFPPESVR